MGSNTFRYYPRERQAAPYWRRRLMALVIGMSALALISWAFSGALGSGPAGGQAAAGSGSGGSAAGGAAGGTGPGSNGGSASGAGSRPTAKPRHRTHQVVQPNYCSKRSIVLSLSATQATFEPSQEPAFDVSVVSTQSATCSFNIGPKFLQLVISKDQTPVWSSADCAKGSGVLVSALRRGSPTTVPFSWNLESSAPGCPEPAAHVPPGTYTAVAEIGSIASNPISVQIS